MKLPMNEIKEPVVLASYRVTNFQLFQMAQSNGMTLDSQGQLFTIRTKLISSFKALNSNKVVNQFALEIITNGIGGVTGKKEVERLKIQTVTKEVQKKITTEAPVEASESQEGEEVSLWSQ